jgi:hypothetical protein
MIVVSFVLVSLCVVIHIVGLVLLAHRLIRIRPIADRELSVTRASALLISVFVSIVLLHLMEVFVWAVYYDLWSLFDDIETSWYFSLGTYTTIGFGDVVLPARWRTLGGLEGLTGVLLCGLSTAFLFAVVNRMFAIRTRRLDAP